jgi:hypothetical protein
MHPAMSVSVGGYPSLEQSPMRGGKSDDNHADMVLKLEEAAIAAVSKAINLIEDRRVRGNPARNQ